MIDFTNVEKAIIDDIKPIFIHSYLIINELNILPTELVKYIIFLRLKISKELNKLTKLRKDIKNCYVDQMINLFDLTKKHNIDIYSPDYDILDYYNHDYKSCKNRYKSIEILYENDNNIYTILLNRLISKTGKKFKDYFYRKNKIIIKFMKTNIKYTRLAILTFES